MVIYKALIFYTHYFYKSLKIIGFTSALYIPLNMFFFHAILALLKRKSSTIASESKALFCATIQSIALVWMFAAIVIRIMEKTSLFSIPLIINEIECIATLVLSVICMRTNFQKFSHTFMGLLFFLVSIPVVSNALIHLSHAFFPASAHSIVHNNIQLLGLSSLIIGIFALIQSLSLKYLSTAQRLQKLNAVLLFVTLFCSNFLAMIIFKLVLIAMGSFL